MLAIAIGLLGLVVILTIAWGTHRRWPRTERQPPTTVVVCARDEEKTLSKTLDSLARQDYPADLYQLVLVNHLSTDSTGEIMEQFAAGAPVPTQVIHLSEPDPVLVGKVHALSVALDHVETEYVLLTDADCVVPERWISTLVSYFTDGVVAVGGMVNVERPRRHGSLIRHLQFVDHRYYLGILAGVSGLFAPDERGRRLGHRLPAWLRHRFRHWRPSALIGNNQGYRMSAYHAVGGYRAIGQTFVEDYALMDSLMKAELGDLALVLDPDSRVITSPQPTLRGLWRQKRRWATGTSHINPLSAFLFLMIILVRVVLPPLALISPVQTLIALILVALADMAVIVQMRRFGGQPLKPRDFIFQEVYMILLHNALLLATVTGWPISWKGASYRPGTLSFRQILRREKPEA